MLRVAGCPILSHSLRKGGRVTSHFGVHADDSALSGGSHSLYEHWLSSHESRRVAHATTLSDDVH